MNRDEVKALALKKIHGRNSATAKTEQRNDARNSEGNDLELRGIERNKRATVHSGGHNSAVEAGVSIRLPQLVKDWPKRPREAYWSLRRDLKQWCDKTGHSRRFNHWVAETAIRGEWETT